MGFDGLCDLSNIMLENGATIRNEKIDGERESNPRADLNGQKMVRQRPNTTPIAFLSTISIADLELLLGEF